MAQTSPAAQGGSRILNDFVAKRQAQRQAEARRDLAKAQERAFAGAQLSRLTDSWRLTSEKIADEIRNDLDALRNRSRQLENNNDFALKYLGMVETNLIGEAAPRLISLVDNEPGKPDSLARSAIAAAWADWSKRGVCEVSGGYSFTEVCQSIVRATARDGEALVLVRRFDRAANKYGFDLQILDVDRLATWLNRTRGDGQNAIVAGVEIDERGRPLAYHFNTGSLAAVNNRRAERIAATEALHRFVAHRPEQTRGIPWCHAAMLSMHYAGEFALSALLAAKHGADHLGFFVTPDGSPPALGDDAADEAGARIATSAPGTWDTLPDGVDVRTVDAKYPNDVFGPFLKTAYQRMSSGLPGASYPELCNDYEAVNFSSIRAAVLSSRDEWRKRHQWFAAAWLEPIFTDWLNCALTMQAIATPTGNPLPLSKIAKFSAHGWQFRGWSWVDPLKDIETAEKGIALKITSRSRIAAEQGRDIEDIFDELQRETALAATYKIDLAPPPPASPGNPMP